MVARTYGAMPPAYVLRPFPQLTSRYDFVLAPPVPFPILSSRTQFNPRDFRLKRPMEIDANETSRPSKKPRQTRRSPTPEVMAKHVSEYNSQLSEEDEDEEESEDDEEEQEREERGLSRAHPALKVAPKVVSAQAGPSQLIPKPKGEPGRPSSGGYTLTKVLGDHGWSRESIAKLMSLTKQGMSITLDAKQSYRQQDKNLIKHVCDVVQQAIPDLVRYESCWPVRSVLKIALKYKAAASKRTEDKEASDRIRAALDRPVSAKAKAKTKV